jgi:hypothetical protein
MLKIDSQVSGPGPAMGARMESEAEAAVLRRRVPEE